MLKEKQDKYCLLCGNTLKGRSDKKFCDDYCRASYNNELKSTANNYMRNVNNALGKNRRILEGLLNNSRQTAKASRDKLIEKGFQFKYHTHQHNGKNGHIYFYCYEYGYLSLENNRLLIVKRNRD